MPKFKFMIKLVNIRTDHGRRMTKQSKEEWLANRVTYIRNLKSPSEQQKLLLMLVETPDRAKDDERKLNALVNAEKAAERAQKAKQKAAALINADKKAIRKQRDHELYKSAGLMILADLVDTGSGKPAADRGMLLGGLISLKHILDGGDGYHSDQWKELGDGVISKREKPAE